MTQTVLLGDLVDVIKGISYRSVDYSDSENGLAFVTLKSVERGGGYNRSGIKYYAGELKDTQYVKSGDILIANTDLTQNREIIGSPLIMPDIGREACFSLDLSKLVIKDSEQQLDKDYLFYYLKSPQVRDYMISHSNGSTVMHLSVKSVPKMLIKLPGIEEQRQIGRTLREIDEKIELNRRMNETLEQMGQALFRHYFIDNPEAEKWEKRELGEFFPIKTGKKDANFGTEDGEYPFFTCAQTISKAPDFSFDAHALLLAGNGDFNLKLYRGKFEAYQRTYVLIPDDERFVGILYFLMKIKLPEITGGSRGSVIKFITKGMIENYKFALPNNSELAEMSEVFNQITVNIEENVKEIQTLTTLRDTLLPRLISGKVKV